METRELFIDPSEKCQYLGCLKGTWELELKQFPFTAKNDSVDSYNQSLDSVTAGRVAKTRGFGYYHSQNCQFYQHFDDELPAFALRMKSVSGLENASVSMIRQDPGQVIPWHQDTFFKLRQSCDASLDSIFRYIVFLEDWKTGHYFQIDDTPIVKWRKGDIYTFPSDTFHLSGNCGIEPKFTLQVSGVAGEKSLHRRSVAGEYLID